MDALPLSGPLCVATAFRFLPRYGARSVEAVHAALIGTAPRKGRREARGRHAPRARTFRGQCFAAGRGGQQLRKEFRKSVLRFHGHVPRLSVRFLPRGRWRDLAHFYRESGSHLSHFGTPATVCRTSKQNRGGDAANTACDEDVASTWLQPRAIELLRPCGDQHEKEFRNSFSFYSEPLRRAAVTSSRVPPLPVCLISRFLSSPALVSKNARHVSCISRNPPRRRNSLPARRGSGIFRGHADHRHRPPQS